MNGKEQESLRLRQGLEKLGFADCRIVHTPGADRVCDTAYKMLCKLFAKAGITPQTASRCTGGKEILLGISSRWEFLRELEPKLQLKITDVSEQDDGFEIRLVGQRLLIAGANGRGVLYGVFALEDYLYAGAEGSVDQFVVPAMRKRSHALGYYWNAYQGMRADEFSEEEAEYLARLRVNQYHGNQDGAGYGPHFFNLVKSPIFPWMQDPDPEYVRKTKKTSRIMKEYGIDYFQWTIEPILPYFAGNVDKYPQEVLGRRSPPDWFLNKPEGIEKTLCINHPMVQEYYFDVAKRFAQEYPDVAGIFLYNNDCQAWFCEPSECEKCQEAAIDPVEGRAFLWENQMRIQNIINAGLKAGRADMQSLYWPTVHFTEDEVKKLLAGVNGYTSITTGWDGQDHDAMVPDAYREPNFAVKLTQQYEQRMGTPLYLYFAYNRSESLPQGFPYPYQTVHAIKRFHDWGIQNILEVTGPSPTCNSITALAVRAAEMDPNLDMDVFLADLCEKQFGREAGALMLEALQAVRDGMEVWNENYIHPYRGSHNELGTGPIMHFPHSLNLDGDDSLISYLKDYTVNKPHLYKDGAQKAAKVQFVDLMMENARHFLRAVDLARQAVALASDTDYITYAYYDMAAEGLDRPTCKQYAEMNYSIIYLAAMFCREKVDKIHSAKLYYEMEAAPDEASRKQLHMQHTRLARDNMPMQEQMLSMFLDFQSRAPHLTRVGMTTRQIDELVEKQKAKIADLQAYLDTYRDEL